MSVDYPHMVLFPVGLQQLPIFSAWRRGDCCRILRSTYHKDPPLAQGVSHVSHIYVSIHHLRNAHLGYNRLALHEEDSSLQQRG